MKIVFMPTLPLTPRDYEYLGIKYFIEKGYDVAVLETHQLLLPSYKSKVDIEYYKIEKTYEPISTKALLEITDMLSSDDFIFYYLGSKEAVILLNKMKKTTKAKFVTYISGCVPSTSSPCGILRQLKAFVRPVIKKVIDTTFETDIVITGAPKDEIIFPFLISKNTKVVQAHSRDYELCLTAVAYQNDNKYCVFLDTDIIDASDYHIFGNKSDNNLEAYHCKLEAFFKWIEKNFGVEVIISAHPKSRVFKNKTNFNGFKVVHNASASLVKGSKFALSEGTTAISFAVYFNKPMLFFTMQELNFFYKHTCAYANQFKKQIINIDDIKHLNINNITQELTSTEYYDNFKYNYLTYKDSSEPIFKIIENELLFGR